MGPGLGGAVMVCNTYRAIASVDNTLRVYCNNAIVNSW